MGQVMAVIIIVLIIIFIFVPLSVLNSNNAEIRNIKQSLNLSARALDNCVSREAANLENLSLGFEKPPENDIKVDKDKLLSEFKDILSKNMCYKTNFKDIYNRVYIKVLVYQDMFYIADSKDRWGPPCFFTLNVENYGQVYLSINENRAYYYDGNAKKYESLSTFDLDEEKKNEAVIKCINDKVAQSTYEIGERNSLKIQIQNPYINDNNERVKMSYFNVLSGVTFFVVYAEDTNINVNSKDFQYKNYNVTGYTMEFGENK
jgi:hypothetical protein